jgi:LysR family transcriptional regulator, flagellar master operon regulator
MDAGLLKAFIEVYRARHFGRAANNLFISQSAISARIKQLEEELGVRLFTRDRNNIELTAAGKKFLVYAENILNSWNRAKQEIAIPEGIEQSISIAALPSLWDIYLDDWLLWLRSEHRSVALQASVMRSDTILHGLLDGSVDVGFVFDPPKTARFIVKSLDKVPLILVSTTAGTSAQEAIRQNYILVDWGTAFNTLHASLYHDMPAPVLRVNTGRIALKLLENTDGAAYLPHAVVADKLGKSLHLVSDAEVIDKEAYAVYSQTSIKSDTIEVLNTWFDDINA